MKRVLPLLMAVVLLLAAVPVCAAEDSALLYGDVNGDGRLNNRDLALLQRYLAHWEVTIDPIAAEISGDDSIDNRDLVQLQRILNKHAVQYPIQLPPDGYDIETREAYKNRIIVEDLTQNGSTVTVKISNISPDWITEETCCVEYICTDAEGNVLSLNDKYYGILYFGMLEIGESVTMTLTLPMGTAKLEFGAYRLVYWSPWKK